MKKSFKKQILNRVKYLSQYLEKQKRKKIPYFNLPSFSLGLISGAVLISLLGMGVLLSGIVNWPNETASQINVFNQETFEMLNNGEENQKEVLAYLRFKEIKASFIPTGVPDVYGQELNISFDQVQDAINKVRIFGPTYGQEGKKIILTGADLERYINIGFQTSCEYCCGARTLVREDGTAACGCAHSIMMRGLAAYLIKNHPELSDEQILEELNTWKRTYFPKQTLSAKLIELEKAGEPGIKELLEEFPEFLPQMVGGC